MTILEFLNTGIREEKKGNVVLPAYFIIYHDAKVFDVVVLCKRRNGAFIGWKDKWLARL